MRGRATGKIDVATLFTVSTMEIPAQQPRSPLPVGTYLKSLDAATDAIEALVMTTLAEAPATDGGWTLDALREQREKMREIEVSARALTQGPSDLFGWVHGTQDTHLVELRRGFDQFVNQASKALSELAESYSPSGSGRGVDRAPTRGSRESGRRCARQETA